MRGAQRDYFARHMQYDLRISKALETDLDRFCRQLRTRGYKPPDPPDPPAKLSQGQIFEP